MVFYQDIICIKCFLNTKDHDSLASELTEYSLFFPDKTQYTSSIGKRKYNVLQNVQTMTSAKPVAEEQNIKIPFIIVKVNDNGLITALRNRRSRRNERCIPNVNKKRYTVPINNHDTIRKIQQEDETKLLRGNEGKHRTE
jgi:hypothetical protein